VASVVVALFSASILSVWAFKTLLLAAGGRGVRIVVASRELMHERQSEVSGSLESLLSYIYVALLSILLLPALRAVAGYLE